MELHLDGIYRTITGDLEVQLLHYFPTEPNYPWVGAIIKDGKVIPCAWNTEGRAQNKLHNLYDVEVGFVYVAKVFIAVRGRDYDEARRNLDRELSMVTNTVDDWLSWSYEWDNRGGDYSRIRLAKGMNPDELAHDDLSLTDLWNNAKAEEK